MRTNLIVLIELNAKQQGQALSLLIALMSFSILWRQSASHVKFLMAVTSSSSGVPITQIRTWCYSSFDLFVCAFNLKRIMKKKCQHLFTYLFDSEQLIIKKFINTTVLKHDIKLNLAQLK